MENFAAPLSYVVSTWLPWSNLKSCHWTLFERTVAHYITSLFEPSKLAT